MDAKENARRAARAEELFAQRHHLAPVPKAAICECYMDCRDCSLSGDWHVHPGEPCPVHPDAPGDH